MICPGESGPATRREFLARNAMGIGGVALAWMLKQDGLLAEPAKPHLPRGPQAHGLAARPALFAPRATAMISLFMHGGPSHVDLFDPKPELQSRSGQDYPGDVVYSFVNRASKKLLGSPWKFEKRGQCGTEISELLPHVAGIADDLCLIRSMHTGHNGHEVSIRFFHGGRAAVLGRPHLGSWLLYGLGSETQNLPAYVVMTDPGGHPVDGPNNWSSGYLPSVYQGTIVRAREPRILNLDPPPHLKGELQDGNLALLRKLNAAHQERHRGEGDLEARIANYELAARMQSAAKEALDISQETAETQALYGLDDDATREYGTRCLLARRLVERGVRFVQIFLAGQPWDNHNNIKETLPAICRRTDKPSAALVRDLKARGLLDTTIVHWGGEIGRLPVTEGDPASGGRDHNGQGFSTWLAGGGIRPGTVYGETDEFGHKAAVNVVTPNDYQATVLHLFGMDHQQLTFHHNGQPQKLTDGNGRVLTEILR